MVQRKTDQNHTHDPGHGSRNTEAQKSKRLVPNGQTQNHGLITGTTTGHGENILHRLERTDKRANEVDDDQWLEVRDRNMTQFVPNSRPINFCGFI